MVTAAALIIPDTRALVPNVMCRAALRVIVPKVEVTVEPTIRSPTVLADPEVSVTLTPEVTAALIVNVRR